MFRTEDENYFIGREVRSLCVLKCLYTCWYLSSLIACLTYSFSAYAGGNINKSGVSPSVINLPSGPGTIDGLGSSFEPQLNSGTGSYSIPIDPLPGRSGFTPNISLSYNGGNGNSVVGMGWNLSVFSIKRQTDKGLPSYVDSDDTFVDASGEELIAVDERFFRAEHEGSFTRYEKKTAQDGLVYWEAQQKNGTKLYFGESSSSRLQNGDHIFSWHLTRQVDVNGNVISYHYAEPTAFEQSLDSLDIHPYLTSVTYNQGSDPNRFMKIAFEYESRPPPNQFISYKTRFPVQMKYRLAKVRMLESGQQVGAYHLGYSAERKVSLLETFTVYGRDETLGPLYGRDETLGTLKSNLTLGYSHLEVNESLTPMDNGFLPGIGLESSDADIADFNGDALPDLFYTGDRHYVFINEDGESWAPRQEVQGAASYIKLSQQNTMMMDMDGDGFTDLLSQDPSINRYSYYSGGHKEILTDNPKWAEYPVEMQSSPGFVFNDLTKSIDLDNDGRTDVISKADLSREMAVAFNDKGLRHLSASIEAPSYSQEFNFSGGEKSAVKMADMNGDGLQDFVLFAGPGQIYYYPSTGVTLHDDTPRQFQGWDVTPRNWPEEISGQEGVWMTEAPDVLDDGDLSEVLVFRSLKTGDINGDGLSDLILVRNNRVRIWLNEGGLGFSDEPIKIGDDSLLIPDLTAKTYIRLADMNANGSKDIVWNRQTGFTELGKGDSSWIYLDLMGSQKPYLLNAINNGIGLVTSFKYKPAIKDRIRDQHEGTPWKYPLPMPINVLSEVEVCDDLMDPDDPCYLTKFDYQDGYYDGAEKEFRGFEVVEKQEIGDRSIATLISQFTYDVGKEDDALKGRQRALEVRGEQGRIYFKEQKKWIVRPLPNEFVESDRPVKFVYQSEKIKTIIEQGQGTPVTLRWQYDYDNFGNQTKVLEHGRLDDGWNDERTTISRYSAEYQTGKKRWILDRPVSVTVYKGVEGTGRKVSGSQYYYDDSAILGEIPNRGLVTEEKTWVSNGRPYISSGRKKYDKHGNVEVIYDPLYTTPDKGHYRAITYDTVFDTFPIREDIIVNSQRTLSVSATYDAGFGKVLSSIDFNGHKTTYDYDTFGRLIAMTKPLDTSTTVEYDYVLAHDLDNGQTINWVETRQRENDGGGSIDSRQFYDGLGRLVMTRSEGETAGQIVVSDTHGIRCDERDSPSKGAREVVVSDTVQFNARKTEARKYLPYCEIGTLAYTTPTYSSNSTQHTYDALGREIQMVQPDGSFSETIYEPMIKTIKDEEQTSEGSSHYGAAMRYEEDGLLNKDGQGRLRIVTELTPDPWVTQYRYDVLDNLTGYTDSQGNQKHITYDGLSRKTFMDDPDRGHMYYAYDEASNLTQTTDAKGQSVDYTYDGVNRLLTETYQGSNEPVVRYHYDAPVGEVSPGSYYGNGVPQSYITNLRTGVAPEEGAGLTASNTLGQLAWVEDEAGQEHYSYDARARKKWTIRQINDGDQTENYYTGMVYDSMDRVTRLTYPDQSYVDYAYNSRGLLESVPNIIDAYDYNPAGQNQTLSLANGTQTEYHYDNRLRLSRLHTAAANDLSLQDLTYTYDAVSNITAITDGRSSATLNALGSQLGLSNSEAQAYQATQSFAYDNLYRLTRARNNATYGTIQYAYDRIGNMVNKDASGLTTSDALMDLGNMSYGGVAGATNRNGRAANDAPGPHALTATQKGPDGQLIFDYDANGNMTQDRDLSYQWDEKDRLTQLNRSNNSQAQYHYDFNNIRKLKKVTNELGQVTGRVHYIDKYAEVRDGKLIKYVYAGASRVARTTQTNTDKQALIPETYYHHDHLGSTNLATNGASEVTEQLVNYPFGRNRLQANINQFNKSDYRFTGKETDTESDLQYFEARYLGVAGQFLSVDPLYVKMSYDLFKPQNANIYSYTANNPAGYVDPSGLARINFGAVSSEVTKTVVKHMANAEAPVGNEAEIANFVIDNSVDTVFDIGTEFVKTGKITPLGFATHMAKRAYSAAKLAGKLSGNDSAETGVQALEQVDTVITGRAIAGPVGALLYSTNIGEGSDMPESVKNAQFNGSAMKARKIESAVNVVKEKFELE